MFVTFSFRTHSKSCGMPRTVAADDEGERMIQEFPFLSAPLLAFVDWLFHKAMHGSKHQYESNVPESARQVLPAVFLKYRIIIFYL
jgi:hypothetical protein